MNTAVIKRIKLGTKIKRNLNGTWRITNHVTGVFIGSLEQVIERGMRSGITEEELEYGISTMVERSHNVADFGVWGTFMFSVNEPEEGMSHETH